MYLLPVDIFVNIVFLSWALSWILPKTIWTSCHTPRPFNYCWLQPFGTSVVLGLLGTCLKHLLSKLRLCRKVCWGVWAVVCSPPASEPFIFCFGLYFLLSVSVAHYSAVIHCYWSSPDALCPSPPPLPFPPHLPLLLLTWLLRGCSVAAPCFPPPRLRTPWGQEHILTGIISLFTPRI